MFNSGVMLMAATSLYVSAAYAKGKQGVFPWTERACKARTTLGDCHFPLMPWISDLLLLILVDGYKYMM